MYVSSTNNLVLAVKDVKDVNSWKGITVYSYLKIIGIYELI